MKICSRSYRDAFSELKPGLRILSAGIIIFLTLLSAAFSVTEISTVFAADKDDFSLLVKYYREKNYPMVKNLAGDLVDKKDYRYHIKIILSEVYFQENDLYYAEFLLKELLDEYPGKKAEIQERLDKVVREKAFVSKGGREQEKRFIIYWGDDHIKDKDVLPVVSHYFDEAYREAGRFFRWYPEQSQRVLLYYGDEYGKYSAMPVWSSGGYDGKIRIMVQKGTDRQNLKEVIFHEYAHVVIHGITKGNCPLWFNEAVAQYFSLKYVYNKDFTAAHPITRPDDFPKNWADKSGADVKRLYSQSLDSLVYIIKKSDESVIQTILESLGKGKNFNSSLDDALSVYGMNSKTLFE